MSVFGGGVNRGGVREGGFAYCDGDVLVHARDEFSGVLMEEFISFFS